MTRWAKVDAGLDSNPKICKAGRAGREVFLFLLRRNALLEADGEIPLTNLDPAYLARQLDMPVTEARDGVTALVTHGLIIVDDHSMRFAGWDEEWQGPRSNAERAAAYRQRKRSKPAEPNDPVTPKNETSRDARDAPFAERKVTDLEERREEEKRREEKREDPPNPPTGGLMGRSVRSRSRSERSDVRVVTVAVVEAFNQTFGRSLDPGGWEKSVSRLLSKGYAEAQMRGVVWWAAREWADDPDMRARVTPKMLLKLQSSQGYRTFDEYLSCAGERWRQEHDGEQPPWEQANQPEIELAAGAS